MIDIQFIPDDWERIDTWAGLFIAELQEGKQIIRIGCSDVETMENDMKKGFFLKPYRQYKTFEGLVLGTVEGVIAHETIHLIIYRWWGLQASATFDYIDEYGEISNNRL